MNKTDIEVHEHPSSKEILDLYLESHRLLMEMTRRASRPIMIARQTEDTQDKEERVKK